MSAGEDPELPRGWSATALRDIAEVQLGKMLDKKRTAGSPLPYLRNINIRWDRIDTSDLLEMPFKPDELDRYSLLPGDVLVCEGGEPGRSAVWTQNESTIKYQKALHRVRLQGQILPRWLVLRLLFDAQRGALASHFTGTTIKHLPRTAFLDYELPIAPLAEQHRIVEALDSYLSRLDEATATLERVQRTLERYRASVLKSAVEGRLVPTEADLARAEGRDYEPASVLLDRILAERRHRWEEAELAKMEAKGKTPKNHKWKAKYKEPAAPETEELPELPEGWCWATVDQLAHVGTGATPKRSEQKYWTDGTIPWVTSSVVNDPVVRVPSEYVTPQALQETNLTIYQPGTVLIAMYGEGKTRGRATVLGIEASTNQALAALELNGPNKLLLDWLVTHMNHNYLKLRKSASGGVQPNLNLGIIRRIHVPLPPLPEQSRINEQVQKQSSVTDSNFSILDHSRKRVARLRQSILKWAFEGKLVDQDPDDEPASVLLDRIRAEREAAKTKTERRKKSAKP